MSSRPLGNHRKRVLVTGATGFVGRTLCELLDLRGYLVRAASRGDAPPQVGVTETIRVGEISSKTDWAAALRDVDCVVHAAARAHVLNDPLANERLYVETNANGTRKLADAAAEAGVRRLVYVSSVKVNGEQSGGGGFTADDEPHPADAYGVSKRLGEQHVMETSRRTGMEAAVVRPPLVYGCGVRANFLRLMQWVDKRMPLPFGAIDNRRSLVSVWNLCDFLLQAIENPRANGCIWMVSDGEDLSTPQLIRRIAQQMQRPARLVPVPISVLRLLGTLSGRRGEITRLCSSLAVDVSPARNELGWVPPLSVDDALGRTVHWYLSRGEAHDG